MFLNVSILSLGLPKISLRKHHASLRYLGKATGGVKNDPIGLLRVKVNTSTRFFGGTSGKTGLNEKKW